MIDVWSAIFAPEGDRVDLTPSPFSLSLPAPGDTVSTNDIDFGWVSSVDPLGRDLQYKLIIGTDSLFVDPVVIWDIPENSYMLTDTLLEGSYYWKVYAYNNQSYYEESNETFRFYATGLTRVGGDGPSAVFPKSFDLRQNYPNPFNPQTTISFDIPGIEGVEASPSHLRIFDVRGRLVRTLFEGEMVSGSYQFSWDGRDDSGHFLPSGIYVYQLKSGEWSSVRKMVLSK